MALSVLPSLIMARRAFLAALTESREQAKLENKLAALQQKLQEGERAGATEPEGHPRGQAASLGHREERQRHVAGGAHTPDHL